MKLGNDEIDDPTRLFSHAKTKSRCDSSLKTKWYRFIGNGGTSLPKTCPATKHCDANAPGWLKGTHPRVAQGVVSRKVCFHYSGDCCYWSRYIKVLNCSGYYVYELKKVSHCYMRYCTTYDGKCCDNNGAPVT